MATKENISSGIVKQYLYRAAFNIDGKKETKSLNG
jgi:hypothetical protein